MDELKPCPFCNKPPITTPSGEGGKGLMIECLTEGCVNPHVSYYNHDVARTAWNTRPREDAGVVDEAMVERAAVAICLVRRPHPNPAAYWHWLHKDEQEQYRNFATAALAAALGRA
jgi:hypothetical protein